MIAILKVLEKFLLVVELRSRNYVILQINIFGHWTRLKEVNTNFGRARKTEATTKWFPVDRGNSKTEETARLCLVGRRLRDLQETEETTKWFPVDRGDNQVTCWQMQLPPGDDQVVPGRQREFQDRGDDQVVPCLQRHKAQPGRQRRQIVKEDSLP
ncbi:hypothetical protein CDAR_166681 [Caerostris darwini]|uniref:Uncharacterized protein n=1 Tax=Caerostris darwini TaxID=1538125 RepID=A0AAV4QSH6_9ARAC|nr:hypothetical protein CDAR_166681 [Caerostris darwini]